MKTRLFAAFSTLSALLMPSLALAHPGHHGHSETFFSSALFSGLVHPVTGLDHLIMLVAFGLILGCIAVSQTKKVKLAGAGIGALLVGLLAGQWLGFSVMVEPAIMVSLFAVSVALWQIFSPSSTRVNTAIYTTIGMIFFHGYAHGVEAANQITQFSLGMALSASALIFVGCMMGQFAKSKWLSVGVALASTLLLLAA